MKKITILSVTLILYQFLFSSLQTLAEPTIANTLGTFNHGGTISIVGSGFGIKPKAAPLKYDDFEGGTADNDLSDWQFSTSNGRNPIYGRDFLRPNSGMSAKARFDNNQYLSSFGIRDMQNGFDEVYMDVWYLYDPASPPSRNHKLFRWYTGTDSGKPDFYMQIFCGTGSWKLETDGGGTSKWYGDNWNWSQANKKWIHMQGYMKINTSGSSNGILQYWIDGMQIENSNNWIYMPGSSNTIWHSLWFGNYLGHDASGGCGESPGDSYTLWDNVYIDNTRARVEIGNNPTYGGSTHREIQIPSGWSDNSITITINQGSFSSGDVVYVYVVDENGDINTNGYPITIGSQGTPDTENPTIPENLKSTDISSSQINLSWNASMDNVGVTGYRIYRDGAQIATTAGTTYQDTGLSPSTTYTYTVSAYDAAGNGSGQSISASEITLDAVNDTEAPTIPTNLQATAISSSQINLSWNASTDNVGVTGYRIYRDGAQIDSTATTTYQDTGLSLSATYTFTVSAFDAAGNESNQSTSVSVTTQEAITIFSNLDSYLGDASNWEPLAPNRWEVVSDGGNLRYGINTTSYSNLSGDRLGEYGLIRNGTYGDFTFTAKVKTTEDLSSNSSADYCVVFGYQDPNNYYYMMFNSSASLSQLFKIVNGSRQLIADAANVNITDNAYHDVKLERTGNTVNVYFDNTLTLTATDSSFSTGQIGIGSFNDASLWDDIIVATISDTIPPLAPQGFGFSVQ